MRKRNIKKVADTIFWYVVYLLPIILTIIQSFGIFGNFTFDNWQFISDNAAASDYGFLTLLEGNLYSLNGGYGLVFTTLISIFGNEGLLPLIWNVPIYSFAEWFVGCVLIHLCVDFILAIPRIAHKWLDDFAKGE